MLLVCSIVELPTCLGTVLMAVSETHALGIKIIIIIIIISESNVEIETPAQND